MIRRWGPLVLAVYVLLQLVAVLVLPWLTVVATTALARLWERLGL